jgi:predicted phosphodiesterase
VTTTIVSDLHLGTTLEADLVRRTGVRGRLADILRAADEVVFLGDLIELRELPLERVLEISRSVLGELSDALSGKRVTIVPGNHDHQLVEPWLERLRIEGAVLSPDWSGDPEGSPLAAELARTLPDSEVRLAYPGLHLRPDVYALHGHYLDLHMTVPRIESVLSQVMARRMLGPDASFESAADYEKAIGPLFALSYGLAQGPGSKAATRNRNLSREVWARVEADGRRPLSGLLLGRVAIPVGVAALNRAGLGPFSTQLSGEELRRAGLRGIAEVVANLGIEADHVIFGHTHRPGPLPGEEGDEGWLTPRGTHLWNTGSWFLESVLVGDRRQESPYWPGGVIHVHDSGPPELVNVLRDLEF